ncbi:MAG: GHMP kinase, partial [Pseudomonadota bacterium]
ACTNALQDALEGYVDPSAAIKENNRLLRHIGVVPDATNEIIHAIETAGGAAKISGAGASSGDKGGIVLVYQPDPDAMEQVMQAYPTLRWESLQASRQGACLHVREPEAEPALDAHTSLVLE